MPSSLGPAEILVILLVALIVLGPNKLPGAARQVGRTLAEVRKWSQGFQDEIRTVIDSEVMPSYPPMETPAPTPLPTLPAETEPPLERGRAAEPDLAAAGTPPQPPAALRPPPMRIPMMPAPTGVAPPAASPNGSVAANGHRPGPLPVDPPSAEQPSAEQPGPTAGEPPRT
jgi:Tat protein translocase TatB subunit